MSLRPTTRLLRALPLKNRALCSKQPCCFERRWNARPSQGRLFHTLGLDPQILASLKTHQFVSPTKIQEEGIPNFLTGGDCVLAAETGSGKTLAYLVPTLQRILHQLNSGVHRDRRFPYAVIVTFNRDLCAQILEVARALTKEITSDKASPPSIVCHTAVGEEAFPAPTVHTTDLLITTPYCLGRNLTNPGLLDSIKLLVVDEADAVLDGHSRKASYAIIMEALKNDHSRKGGEGKEFDKQLVFVAATIPNQGAKNTQQWLEDTIPQAQWTRMERVHKHLPNQTLEFVQVKQEKESVDLNALNKRVDEEFQMKNSSILEQLEFNHDRNSAQEPQGSFPTRQDAFLEVIQKNRGLKRTLVFANTVKTVDHIQRLLRRHGLEADTFHKGARFEQREELLKRFNTGDVPLLLCTSAAARGIDFHHVNHVVQYDFATNVVDHLHRIGRASRMNVVQKVQEVKVTNLFSEKDTDLVNSIQEQGSAALDESFSRRRRFSRKLKKKRRWLESQS